MSNNGYDYECVKLCIQHNVCSFIFTTFFKRIACLNVTFDSFSHSATCWPNCWSTTQPTRAVYCLSLFIVHSVWHIVVENMVIDSQTNTYASSRIMHLPCVYMLTNEGLGLHSVVNKSLYSHVAVYNLKTWLNEYYIKQRAIFTLLSSAWVRRITVKLLVFQQDYTEDKNNDKIQFVKCMHDGLYDDYEIYPIITRSSRNVVQPRCRGQKPSHTNMWHLLEASLNIAYVHWRNSFDIFGKCTLLPGCRWTDQYHSHICVPNM